MGFLRKLMVGLAALVALPLVAQGPVPQRPAEEPAGPAVPASAATAERAELDAADVASRKPVDPQTALFRPGSSASPAARSHSRIVSRLSHAISAA